MKKKVRRFESGIRTKGIEEYLYNWFPLMNIKTGEVDYHGERYIFKFPNGYGASVIRHYGAYCDLNVMMPIEKVREYKPKECRLYEIGFLDRDGFLAEAPLNWYFEYGQVAGRLNYEEINDVLEIIENIEE